MSFDFLKTDISGLTIIEPRLLEDNRGYFFESYKASEFGISERLVQINQSYSHKNVIRGLHFQVGKSAQAKLIRCLSGEIYDVAVDIRKSSPTFGKYFDINLSAENKKMLYIPIGFAHGFSTISESAEITYSVFGGEYDATAESGIRFDDADIGIDWRVENEILSQKDLDLPLLKDLKYSF